MRSMKKSAQSLIEYGLILALVAVIAITVLSKFGKTITNSANTTDTTVNKASTQASTAYCSGIGSTVNTTTGACN